MGLCKSKSELEQVFETSLQPYDNILRGCINRETYNRIVKTFPVTMWKNFRFYHDSEIWITNPKSVASWVQSNPLKPCTLDLEPTELQDYVMLFIVQLQEICKNAQYIDFTITSQVE